MKTHNTAVLLLLALSGCSAPHAGNHPANPQAAQQFERLKSLAGSWVTEGADPIAAEATGSITTYEVTAAGHALEETEFAGSEQEMLTLYAIEDGQLTLRHYCILGNRPHMVAAPSTDPDVISFTCDGEGLDCATDQHMHQGVLSFRSDGKLRSDWTMWQDGRPIESVGFVLARQ